MTDTQARVIAGRLTLCQKYWLIGAWYGNKGWQIKYRKKAIDLGLCYPGTSRLTPLGLAVREHLERKP